MTSQKLFGDADDMLRLEKVEFGGIRGNQLSHQIENLFNEFNETFKVFTDLKYDPLDPEDEVRRTRSFCLAI